jgi:purine-binding chemotaxis protein CheW
MGAKDGERQQIIVFKLDERLYGVNIGQIREITRIGEIAPVPNSPPYINGVTNLRGQVTTVIDLRKRLGLPQKGFDKESRMMVLESEGKSVAMIVDSVAEVTMLPRSDIEETPELTRVDEDRSSYLKGIGKKEGKLIILVDLHELLEWKTLDANVPQEIVAEPEALTQRAAK